VDPEKPNSDSTGGRPSGRPPGEPSVEQRVEGLSGRTRKQQSERQSASGSGSGAESNRDAPGDRKDASRARGSDDPAGRPANDRNAPGSHAPPAARTPRLTERQRIEAREQRRRGGRSRNRKPSRTSTGSGKGSRSGSDSGNPLSRGVRATLVELRRTGGFFKALILTALDRLGPAIRWLTAGLLSLLAAVGTVLSRLLRALGVAAARIGKLLVLIDRAVTPRRAFFVVAGAGATALVVSQFLDFRATEVGQAAYDPIQEITRAPRIDVQTPIDSHSILLIVVGAAALAGLAGAVLSGRRLFGALVALSGIATIAVTLLIDLANGLDVAVAEISYSGVAAVLLSGFWLQLSAGFVLTTSGLGLLALGGQRRSSRERMRERGSRPKRSGDHRSNRSDDSPGAVDPGRDSARSAGPRTVDAGGLS
jgi:hypothetical protein